MLNPAITEALDAQLALEANSSAHYLAIASWCDKEGLNGCAEFFYAQADEEREHMLKIVHYMNEMDGHATVPATEQPPKSYPSIQEVFKIVYAQEQKVTASVHNLVNLASQNNDHATYQFMQWYVAEQREEEALVRTILDKIRLIGNGGQSLYFIDNELQSINKARLAAEAAGEE